MTACRAALLAGTAWIALGVPAQAQDQTLETIVVEGRGQGGARTEGTGVYSTSTATIGREAVPITQIPNSVAVVTRQEIQDRNFTQLEDALRTTPGTLVLRNDPGRSSLFSRGFELDNLLINGLPAPVSSIYGTQPDLVIFDRVEVMRGPAAFFSGSGEPGGAVNLVLRQPTRTFQAEATAQIRSFNDRRTEIDIGGPLNTEGSFRGRFIGAFQDRDSFVNIVENQVGIAYGTLEFDLTDRTRLMVAGIHQQREITPFNGLPSYPNGSLLDIGRQTFIGASWNRFSMRSTEGIADLEHRLDNGGRLRLATRVTDRESNFHYAFSASAISPANTTTITSLARDYTERTISIDGNYSQPFELLGQTQNLLVGADFRRYEQRTGNGQRNGFTPAQNVFSPNPYFAEPINPYTALTETDPQLFGVYGQLRLRPIQPLTFVLGGRVNWYDNTSTDLVTNIATQINIDNRFSPYLGVIYELTPSLSFYASYSDIFQPQTNLDRSGQPLAPRVGSQYEAGARVTYNGLNISGAFFRIRDENRALADASLPGAFVAAGEVEVEGFEAQISGRVLPGFQIVGSYTYTESAYIRGTTAQVGTVFSPFTPRHVFNLWGRYDFQPESGLQGVHVAGGVKVVSSFFNQSGAVRLEEDGYAVFDAQIGYAVSRNVNATFSVTNIFDERYYERLGSTTVFNFYGEPRAFMVRLQGRL